VVLEVDGSHHLDVEHWGADIKRERKVVITRRTVLRATAFEARYEQAELAADLLAIGIPRLVRG
jgi:very-short-patch-repair endonuclease